MNRCGESLTSTIAIRKSMTKSTKSTKVKALDFQLLNRSNPVANVTNDKTILNSNRRRNSDVSNRKNGLSKPYKMFKVASLNCRTLQTDSSIVKLNKLIHNPLTLLVFKNTGLFINLHSWSKSSIVVKIYIIKVRERT